MPIPAAPPPGVQLDKTHTALNEPAGQQAVAPERRGIGIVESVQLLSGFSFLGQLNRFRSSRLHLISQLIGADTRFELGIAGVLLREALIEVLQKIELAALLLLRGAGGRLQVQDGRIALAKLR